LHLLEAVPQEVVEANPATVLITATTICLTPVLGYITVVALTVAGITAAVIAVGIAAVVMAAVLVVAVMVVVLAVVMVAVLAVAVMVAVLAVEDIKRANFLLDNFPFPALIAYVESRRCLTTSPSAWCSCSWGKPRHMRVCRETRPTQWLPLAKRLSMREKTALLHRSASTLVNFTNEMRLVLSSQKVGFYLLELD
jgi:lysylphosphatidylglycerol synthetase-like protein (DUF2156 family)